MSASFIQANTNGRLHPADEPSITPLDRGFLYGDAIYEVWRTYQGSLFAWEEHCRRLEDSARALYLELPWSRAELLAEVKRTAAAFRAAARFDGELYVRLQISRGAGPIGLDVRLAGKAMFLLLVQPCPAPPEKVRREGLTLAIASSIRRNPAASLDPAWKTGNYLNNILGLRDARARGADEVVMLNLQGEITEASTSNIAFVRDGAVITPPATAGILQGITRGLLLHPIAHTAGCAIREATVRPEDLAGMQECFLLSTTRDVTPAGAIDGIRFEVGDHTVAARLKRAFREYAARYATDHPGLRV
jgi:branched-chain amino acid aminotransferase